MRVPGAFVQAHAASAGRVARSGVDGLLRLPSVGEWVSQIEQLNEKPEYPPPRHTSLTRRRRVAACRRRRRRRAWLSTERTASQVDDWVHAQACSVDRGGGREGEDCFPLCTDVAEDLIVHGKKALQLSPAFYPKRSLPTMPCQRRNCLHVDGRGPAKMDTLAARGEWRWRTA
eukprot:365852-Chlamydomonas_euryale.AAC.7